MISKLLKSCFTFKTLQVRLSQPDQEEKEQEEIPQQRQEVKEQRFEEGELERLRHEIAILEQVRDKDIPFCVQLVDFKEVLTNGEDSL